MLGRAFLIGVVMTLAEVLQGILRVRLLNRRVGDRRARRLGVVAGSILILVIAWAALPWIGARRMSEWITVGVIWGLWMLVVDLAFGRLVFRFSWRRIASDFDPRQGGWLGFGMLVVFLAPLVAAWWRGWL